MATYFTSGIAARNFERSFQLADHVAGQGVRAFRERAPGIIGPGARDPRGNEAPGDPDRELHSKVLEVQPTKPAASKI